MNNALVNRIKQRLEARRDFMRSVFSRHHALTWRMTDAPSLRALGLAPKKTEPNRVKTIQISRAAKVQPRTPRAFELSDLGDQVFETESLSRIGEPTLEMISVDSSFVAQENSSFEARESMGLEDQLEEPSEPFEKPLDRISTKLEPGHARENLERLDLPVIPKSRADVAPSIRSGELTPSEVLAQVSIEKIVSEGVLPPQVQLDEVTSLDPEETRVLESNEITTESPKLDDTQIIQNTNNSIIESISESEKIQNPQLRQNEPLTAARASETLKKRAAQASQPDLSKAPVQVQKIVPELQNQLEPSVLQGTSNQQTPNLESNEITRLENQTEAPLEPVLRTQDLVESPQVSAENLMPDKVQSSRFETAIEKSMPNIETLEVRTEESSVSEIQTSDFAPREIISEIAQIEIQEGIQTPQESASQESTPRESQQQFDAREIQSESAFVQPSIPEQPDWQRSIPGDPQSGVVEIIRAKPPRNVRPEKPTETREEPAKPQPTETRVSQSLESEVQPKQNLSERMKLLQQRFGANEQTRFDPSSNAFSERVEPDNTGQTPAPKFQSISDVAQRLSRRYSEIPTTTSSEEENNSPDLKVGQQLNQTQTRAASEFVQQGTQPVQLRESTRTFLAPLIGFDPSQARVFVGASASEFTSSLNADGATVATDVYLNNGFDEQSPEGLGLLAHELTHVGQNLQPDFVPPMLQNAPDQKDLTGQSLETQARALEARVTNTASMFVPGIALESIGLSRTSTALPAPKMNAARDTNAWNGLPAPWEAMPNLNTNSTDFVTVIAPSSVGSSSSTSTGFAPVVDAPSAGLQLAESDRSVENPDNQPAGAAGGQPHPPAQDLDVLAHQVYEILKRKLSSERRREG
jgi:hypothetical protein